MNPESSLIRAQWARFKARVDHIIHLHKKENPLEPEIVFQKGDILVVRHAQSQSNVEGQEFVQHPKLTEKGIEQARKMGKLLKKNKTKFDLVVTSGSIRAEQTAVNIMQELGQTIPMIVERSFRERNIGVYSNVLGERTGEVQIRFNQWNESLSDETRWDARPNEIEGLDLKYFETERDTAKRFRKALETLKEKFPGKSILVVSHFYTMSSGLAALDQATPDPQRSIFKRISNTGYFTIRPEQKTESDVVFRVVQSNPKGPTTSQPAREEGRVLKNALEIFLRNNQTEYDLRIDSTKTEGKPTVHLYLPTSEREREQYYLDRIDKAIEINEGIWGEMPRNINFIFTDTTEQFNSYRKIVGSNILKIKKDRLKAMCGQICADSVDIICFTEKGLEAETNKNITQPGKTSEEVLEMLLTHEVNHGVVNQRYGLPKGRQIEGWINEGVAMLFDAEPSWVNQQPIVQRLSMFLANYSLPPTDKVLMNSYFPGREEAAPAGYIYGLFFLSWSIQNFSPHSSISPVVATLTDRRKIIPVLLENYSKQRRGNFSEAYKQTFGIPYQEAYDRFKDYLKEKAKQEENQS